MSGTAADLSEEYRFLIHDVLEANTIPATGYADLSPDLTVQILEGVSRFAREVLTPQNAAWDHQGCRVENGVVRTPSGFAEAYRAFCEAGWNRLGAEDGHGGMFVPGVVATAAREIVAGASAAFSQIPALTFGAMQSVARAGDAWMREHVVPRMVSGEWTGTMCLTEPHCGTDLRMMTTRATPLPDGSYRIDGTKIFISGGDHDLTDNIIHLVLAKLPNAQGVYRDDLGSVALFLVPKMTIDRDGRATGSRNGVGCGGVEKKLGIKASPVCVLNFDDAIGYRLGSTKPDAAITSNSSGMSAMFDMMNHARLGTGMLGIAIASNGYARSAAYARERTSGRAANTALRGEGRADPIVVHADVRRLLLEQASFVEGARAVSLWTATLLDQAETASDPKVRRRCGALASLLTPVIKAFFSDRGCESTAMAMQVFGGHGYIVETGIEQLLRDVRIAPLYEGANGIQALDLVARKLPGEGGVALAGLASDMDRLARRHAKSVDLACQAEALRAGLHGLAACVNRLEASASDPDAPGAISYDLLTLLGIVIVGYMWLRIGVTSATKLANGNDAREFHQRKLLLGRFWAERKMPQVQALASSLKHGSSTLMTLSSEAF